MENHWANTSCHGTCDGALTSVELEEGSAIGNGICGGGTYHWKRFLGLCLLAIFLFGIAARLSGWDVLSTIYYAIATSCTIGYGDFVLTTQVERLMAVIYIPLVCLIMGHWLAYVANTIINKQSSQFCYNSDVRNNLRNFDAILTWETTCTISVQLWCEK